MKTFCIAMLMIFSLVALGQTPDETENSNGTKNLKIFPNPATNVVNVIGLQNSKVASVLISDIYGTKVLMREWEVKNNALNIPVANLRTGIYFISITSEVHHIKVKFYKN